jgi:hypothetical protein
VGEGNVCGTNLGTGPSKFELLVTFLAVLFANFLANVFADSGQLVRPITAVRL